jgi:hypothetical protein
MPDADAPFQPGTAHRRRLREVWRSAGWPFQDPLEAELLAAGLLARERDAQGRDTLRVTDAGVAVLAQTLQRNRAAHDAHEALVARVAREMQHAGRIVWRGLSLRARIGAAPAAAPTAGVAAAGSLPLLAAEPAVPMPDGGLADASAPTTDDGAWVIAMPDVYSIRHTTVEHYLAPVAHEIKVRRADLLADLRRPGKGEAYRWLASECWYVIAEGIARPDEIPGAYGVLVAPPLGPLQVARPAPQRAMQLPFAVWMALARAVPEPAPQGIQRHLGEPAD